MTRTIFWAAMAISLSAASGCSETIDNPPDGFFRMIHAAPGETAVDFLLEEVPQSTLGYKQGTQLRSLDSGPFDFNVEIRRLDDPDPARVLSFRVNMMADHEHTFVLIDDAGSLGTILLDKPTQPFDDATQSEVQILHVAPALGAVDVYLEAPGANIPGAMPLDSLAFGEDVEPMLLAGGDYQLTLTTVGDPTDVLFSSDTFTLDESVSFLALLVDGAGQGTAALSLLLVDAATSQEIFDESTLPGLRVVHASAASGGLDVALDNDFNNLFLADVIFGTITDFLTVPDPESQITVTPAGNSGVMEFDQALDLSKAALYTLFLTGEPGDIAGAVIEDDFRGLRRNPRLRVYNGSSERGVDVYLVPPGTTDLSDESPAIFAVPVSGVSPVVRVPTGDFDLLFTAVADDTIIGGPVSVSLQRRRTYSVATFDEPGGMGFTITLVDGFPAAAK